MITEWELLLRLEITASGFFAADDEVQLVSKAQVECFIKTSLLGFSPNHHIIIEKI
jgi:hypothetical protein